MTFDRYFSTGIEWRKDLNLPPGSLQEATGRIIYDRSLRPFPTIGQIIQRENTASSRYNFLTFALNKRFSHHIQAQVFYTNGHNRTDDDNENTCCSNSGYDQRNYRLDWGRSNLDIRHNLVLNAVILLPKGVEVSPIVRFQSGRPFDATTGSDSTTAYDLSTPALTNFRQYIGKPDATVFGGGNGDATTSDRPMVNGKVLVRNDFEQPAYFRTDLRVAKVVRFKETKELKFTLDIFNVFKSANKFTTNTQISSPAFGLLNNADEPFSVQTGVRFSF